MPRRAVLLPASEKSRAPYLSPAPVASTSAVPYEPAPGTLRCSQCNLVRPIADFPLRLVNLQPYQVCFAHEWYWTDAKRAQLWVPDHTSTLEEACDAFREIAKDDAEYDDRFMIDGDEGDLHHIVDSLARAGDWKIKELKPRRSRAKGASDNPPPPPTFLYAFRERRNPKVNKFKLTVWFHRNERKFTMTLKPEIKKDRAGAPWARPERRLSQVAAKTQAVEMGQDGQPIPSPSPTRNRGAAKHGADSSPHRNSAASPATTALSRAQVDAQQMPPPPIPPRKKARRVEPSLVSPSLPRPPPAPSLPLATASSNGLYSPLLPLDHPSLAGDGHGTAQHPWRTTEDASILPTPPAAYSYPGTNSSSMPSTATVPNPAAPRQTTNNGLSNRSFDSTALTLFEMLANPAFDPPIIPLLPRPPRPANLNANSNGGGATSAGKNPRSRRELEDAVADALGTKRFSRHSGSDARQTGDHDQEEDDDDEVELGTGSAEEDYEDSIPDDSSGDDDDEEDEDDRTDARGQRGGEDDDDDASSFFESSTEEYSQFGSEEEEEDDEDDEEEEGDDWLAGFVSKQMPGMVTSQGEEDDEDEEEGVEEAGEASRPREAASAKHGRAGKGNEVSGVDDDEVDELQSSGED